MKLISMLIALALIGYASWDMFGDDFASSAQSATGKPVTAMSTAMDLINSEDFQVEFEPATGWYQIRSIKDPTIRLKAREEELAAVLRSAKKLQAPTVRIIYPASFVSAGRQDAYETQIRSLLQPIRAVVSFQRTLD